MTGPPLILLAPSEEKASGGLRGRLPEMPAQRWVRDRLVALAKIGFPEAMQKAFDVKGLALDKARTEALALAGPVPLLPALSRYTGVAFQALDAASLPPEVWRQVFILSNLRGLVARWILTHQQGDPRRVLKGRIAGCQWAGVSENDRGGLALRLLVEP